MGGVELALTIDELHARRLRRNPLYRALKGGNAVLARRAHQTGTAPSAASSVAVVTAGHRQRELSPEAREIADRVGALDWYHVLELPHGIRTPGRIDLRGEIGQYGLPPDMRGMRALDIATFDGFLAFEMERRGAEVIATDLARGSISERAKERLDGAYETFSHDLPATRGKGPSQPNTACVGCMLVEKLVPSIVASTMRVAAPRESLSVARESSKPTVPNSPTTRIRSGYGTKPCDGWADLYLASPRIDVAVPRHVLNELWAHGARQPCHLLTAHVRSQADSQKLEAL